MIISKICWCLLYFFRDTQVHKKLCIPLPGIFQRGRLYKAQSCSSIVRDKVNQSQTNPTAARHSALFSDKSRILRNCLGVRLLGSDSDINQNNSKPSSPQQPPTAAAVLFSMQTATVATGGCGGGGGAVINNKSSCNNIPKSPSSIHHHHSHHILDTSLCSSKCW